mgnify:CR=1 FL=1
MGIYKALKKRSEDPNWRPRNKERMLQRIEEGIKRNEKIVADNRNPAKVSLAQTKLQFLKTKKEEISNY